MSDFDLLPDQPSAADQIRRVGPPALIAIAALLFIVQNTESVRFEFLWFDFEWPLWIMLLVFTAVGATVAYGIGRRLRARRERRRFDDAG